MRLLGNTASKLMIYFKHLTRNNEIKPKQRSVYLQNRKYLQFYIIAWSDDRINLFVNRLILL